MRCHMEYGYSSVGGSVVVDTILSFGILESNTDQQLIYVNEVSRLNLDWAK